MQQSAIHDLVLKSRENDQHAFRKLVETHQAMVFSLAFRLLCDENDARDIVQETFLKAWKYLNRYDTDKKFSTWLYSIASNLCYDQLKSTRRRTANQPMNPNVLENLISDENIEQSLINTELAGIITALTGELSPKQKLVFTLRDLEGLEIEEIEEITGLSPEKIKSNLYLARQYIRRKIETIN